MSIQQYRRYLPLSKYAAGTAGVATFNGRTGAVTLTSADVATAGGATLTSPSFTGNPTAPTPSAGDNDTSIATTAFVTGGIATAIAPLATLASPAFTGNPTAPTPTVGDNDTSIATTAFVQAAMAASGVSSWNTRTGAVTLSNADVIAVLPSSSASPAMNGAVSAGVGTAWSRSDHVHPSDTSLLAKAGGTMTGALTLAADPTVALGAATKQYVDAVTVVTTTGLCAPTGRLTLVSGVPYIASNDQGDQLAKTAIYWTLVNGNTYPWYNGSAWTTRTLAGELTCTLDATGHVISKNYDLFLFNDAGTDRLVSVAWLNDVLRASAISVSSGFYINTSSMTGRYSSTNVTVPASQGLYVGTFRTSAAGQTQWKFGSDASGGGEAWLGLWNRFNQADILLTVNDSDAAHSITTATARPWANSTTMRASFVRGLNEWPVFSQIMAVQSTIAANGAIIVGVGVDSTLNFDGTRARAGTSAVSVGVTGVGQYDSYLQIGWHYIQVIEQGDGSNANTLSTTGAAGDFRTRIRG